jgi:transposase InsO family protein
MTVKEKLVARKVTLLELAVYLDNVSAACRMHGVSRQHFYDIKDTFETQGAAGLHEKSRRKPNLHNRVATPVEEAVVRWANEQPAYGQLRVANEMRQEGLFVSPSGVREIWKRHGLTTRKQRFTALETRVAKEGLILTESQVQALERYERSRTQSIDEIETHHPGYLVGQDTFYVGTLKGVGRIYQQTGIDTYSSVAFAKLYVTKVPLTAADLLNDRVLPFFDQHDIPVLRVLTDCGNEFCGRQDRHPYEMFLELNDIEHTRTKPAHPQTNGITERFHGTILNEFYRVAFRKKLYKTLEELQLDLDEWLVQYNHHRTHQGKRCQGRTPMQTFLAGLVSARELLLPAPEAA